MRSLIAGMTLAVLGHVAHANPYLDSAPNPTLADSAAAPSSEGRADTADPASAPAQTGTAQPGNDLAALFNSQPTPTSAQPDPAAAAVGASPAAQPAAASEGFATAPRDLAVPAAERAGDQQRSLLAGGPKPSQLMAELMKAPANAPLAGTPMTLGEAVRDSRTRADQTQRARAYWDLAASVADYYLAVLEAQELDAYRAGISAPSQQWDVRIADSKTRIEAARLNAQSAQLQLHNLLGGAATTLPLPADVPHCGRYNAEYAEIFASRPDPTAKKLAEVLSLRHSELRAMNRAIDDAKALVESAVATRHPSSDGGELLTAQQLLALQRRQFVARAREYNQEIAAYTELAAPSQVAPSRLVAMMIRTSTTTDQLPWRDAPVEPASAVEPAEPASVADATPTFQPERRQEVRRPLQRLLGRDREQSIVVKRLRNLMDRE
jgi:hypothetical protein